MLKKILIQAVVVLFIVVGAIGCERAYADEHSHTSVEIVAADDAVLLAQVQAARCFMYEALSTNRPEDLDIFDRKMGVFTPYLAYHMGHATGKVKTTAQFLFNSVTHVSIHNAAKILYAQEKCNPVEHT